MGKKLLLTNKEWLKKFSDKLFLTEEPLSLSIRMSSKHPHLSADHLYYLVIQVLRFICYEITSNRYNVENEPIKMINALRQIIENDIGFDETCSSEDIINLWLLNSGNIEIISWVLSDAVGPRANKLSPLPNTADYNLAAKEIIREAILLLFRDFYNFIITRPDPSHTQQNLAAELKSALSKRELDPIKDRITKGNHETVKQVKFNLNSSNNSDPRDEIKPPPSKFKKKFTSCLQS